MSLYLRFNIGFPRLFDRNLNLRGLEYVARPSNSLYIMVIIIKYIASSS